MAAIPPRPNLLVEESCNSIINTVRSLPLNFSIVETPYSVYLTVRKSLVRNASSLGNVKKESQDEKVKMLEESNQRLKANFEELVIECKENTKYIHDIEDKNEILLEKLEKAEKN